MLRASIALMDDSVLIEDAEMQARDSRRGTGDGHVWRGAFLVPGPGRKPTIGETIHLRFDERSLVAAVVTQIEGARVHFRARGKAPVQKDPAVLQGEGASAESAQSGRSPP